ncbi:uroporphyrinogen-III synthase [Pontivivens nitratireducens]|uniref:uroporphyrinogen-III synthase n=1 Tax=Pontivivens nitratireducens TaxID=2758038 RepID=UPI00163AF6DB
MTGISVTRVLLTRPSAQSQDFAQALGPGFEVLTSPLLEIRFLNPVVDTGPARAVVFTSTNGVAGWRRRNGTCTLPAFCVGARTAQAARAAGFPIAATAPTLIALAPHLREQSSGPLLHIRGTHVSAELADLLPDRQIATCITYEAEARPLSPDAHHALEAGEIDMIPVFSPRTAARLLAERTDRWRLDATRLIAISPATARILAPLASKGVETSPTPDTNGLLALLHRKSAQC